MGGYLRIFKDIFRIFKDILGIFRVFKGKKWMACDLERGTDPYEVTNCLLGRSNKLLLRMGIYILLRGNKLCHR